MSTEIAEVKNALYQHPVVATAGGVEPVERLISIFEQFPQNYQMAFFTMSAVGIIGLTAYAIHCGYSVTKKEHGWSFSPASSVA